MTFKPTCATCRSWQPTRPADYIGACTNPDAGCTTACTHTCPLYASTYAPPATTTADRASDDAAAEASMAQRVREARGRV